MEQDNEKNNEQEQEQQEQEETPVAQEQVLTPEQKLEEKIKELENDLAASRADFYNYRQRAIKERQEIRKRSAEDVIINILPVLDNLDRALEAASSEDSKSILKGVEMVQRQFISVLENLGVSVINSKGQAFDPTLHDATGTEEIEDPELDGKVTTERLKGYRTQERVLRPAQVLVGKLK